MSINIAKALKPHSKQRLFIIYCYLTQDSQNVFSIEMLFFSRNSYQSRLLVVNESHLQTSPLYWRSEESSQSWLCMESFYSRYLSCPQTN